VLGTAELDSKVDRYLIVGCEAGSSGCVQRIVRGDLVSWGGSGSFSLAVDEVGFESVRVGAPVVDELGNAVGVVHTRFFDGAAPEGRRAYQVWCASLHGSIPRIVDQRSSSIDLSSVGGNGAVEEAAVELIGTRRWDDLGRLADWVALERASDGSWLGEGVVRAFGRRTIDPGVGPGSSTFDAVGAALDEWIEKTPSEPLAMDAQVIHALANPPVPPADVIWSHDDAAAAREMQCRILSDAIGRHIEAFPNDLYALVAGVRWAAGCGGIDDVSAALGRLAGVAPELTPVYADAVRGLKSRQRWSAAEAGTFIDSVLGGSGPEVRETLYGVTMINEALRREPDPTIDTLRIADEYGRWIDLYPGSSFAETRLVGLLCRMGETERAAARLDIRLCSEVRTAGSTWSTAICRECFGGDVIPRSAVTATNPTAP